MLGERPSIVVVLGTGGTIAGLAADADDEIGYVAGQLGVAQLVGAVAGLAGVPRELEQLELEQLEVEQLAQIDSKDMGYALWLRLATAVDRHLARPEVGGVVVTHGTDTLEETAYFLQRVLAPTKPVVLTGSMRPASSARADGPQNLADAVAVARAPGAHGVVAVLAGTVHGALDVRKLHTSRPDAFGSGDAGPVATIAGGQVSLHRPWPTSPAIGLMQLPQDPTRWPQVEIVTSHAGATRSLTDAAVRAGARGIVLAGTGNGSVHRSIEAALRDAEATGVAVLRSSRCLNGSVVDARRADAGGAPFESAGALTPTQARIELMLRLLAAPSGAA